MDWPCSLGGACGTEHGHATGSRRHSLAGHRVHHLLISRWTRPTPRPSPYSRRPPRTPPPGARRRGRTPVGRRAARDSCGRARGGSGRLRAGSVRPGRRLRARHHRAHPDSSPAGDRRSEHPPGAPCSVIAARAPRARARLEGHQRQPLSGRRGSVVRGQFPVGAGSAARPSRRSCSSPVNHHRGGHTPRLTAPGRPYPPPIMPPRM